MPMRRSILLTLSHGGGQDPKGISMSAGEIIHVIQATIALSGDIPLIAPFKMASAFQIVGIVQSTR